MSELPPAGWYPDPGGSGAERWWDGQQWTGYLRPLSLASNWRGWLARSPRAIMIGRAVATAAGLCATGAFLVGLLDLLRGKPIHGVGISLVVAIPVLAVGQVWMIAQINSRVSRPRGSWRAQLRAQRAMSARAFFFNTLPMRIAGPLLALAFLGWLSAMFAFSALSQGGPDSPAPGCPYRLSNHGSFTCVSKARYDNAGAGEQRFASGILLAFFALHTGGALGGLRRAGLPS